MGSVLQLLAGLVLAGVLAACGGGGGGSGGGDGSAAATPPVAASITSQPADQSVVAGTTATFTVGTTAASAYQWHRSTDGGATFVAIAGATAAAYTTPVALLADSGTQYRVVVSGAANSVTSSAATLTVVAAVVAPSISVQPADRAITAGADANFSVTAAGTNLAYQWQGSPDGIAFSDLPGETNATLTLRAVPLAADAARVRVVVSNTVGSVTSTAALLTVTAAQAVPAFTTQPVSAVVAAPAGATFTAAATGVPAPTLQWQRSTDGGVSFADIGGATGASFVVFDTTEGDDVRIYRVIATNSAGSVASNVVTLTVNPAPVAPSFTTQPVSVSIVAGQSTQFSVAASGTPTPTVQWQLSTDNGSTWSNITGATGNIFDVLGAAQGNNGRQFRAVASNSAGTVNSNAAVLTVTPASVLAITTATLPAGVSNVPYSATLTATGGTPPYSWSSPAASLLRTYGLVLDPSTGQISGTPNAALSLSFRVEVSDSAATPASAQQDFSLVLEPPCDFGAVTVAGAPSTVQGKFCPQTSRPPGAVNPSNGLADAFWSEDDTAARVFEGLLVQFNPATNEIASISFSLNDPTRLWTYLCAPNAAPDYPACSGVTIDAATGTLTFVNTVVGSGTAPPFTLNGSLRY